MAWNVGGNADCISKTILPDDIDGGSLRGLTTHVAGGGCTAQTGAYMRYNVVYSGGQILLNNGIPIFDRWLDSVRLRPGAGGRLALRLCARPDGPGTAEGCSPDPCIQAAPGNPLRRVSFFWD